MSVKRISWMLVLGGLLISACSSSEPVVDTTPDTIVVGPTRWDEAETLDIDRFADTLPEVSDNVDHEVPEILMMSAADDSVRQEIQGFRVQVFSSVNRNETVAVEEQVRRWLTALDDVARDTLGQSQARSPGSIRLRYQASSARLAGLDTHL